MRQLVESQLELLGQLTSRVEAARARRVHLLDLLKTVWLQLANLRAQAAVDPGRGLDVTDRMRALCDEIARQSAAADEVARLLPSTLEIRGAHSQ